MVKVNPGPWSLVEKSRGSNPEIAEISYHVLDGAGRLIAKVQVYQAIEGERIARQMAASDSLLSALIGMVQPNRDDLTIKEYDRARAAISKAEGRA